MGLFGIGGDSQATQTSEQVTQSTTGTNSPTFSGKKSKNNIGSSVLSVAKGGTISITQPDSLAPAALSLVQDTVRDALNSVGSAQGNSQATLAAALQRDQAIAADTASGGGSSAGKLVLYIFGTLAVVAGAVVYFIFRKPQKT